MLKGWGGVGQDGPRAVLSGSAGRGGFAARYLKPLAEAAQRGSAGPPASQRYVAQMLAERGFEVSESSLTRYLKGDRRPDLGFVRALHSLAAERSASARPAGIAWDAAVEAYERVVWCKNCADLDDEIAGLRRDNEARAESLAALAQQVAGLQRLSRAVRRRAALPPVPPSAGDRRGESSDADAARSFAATTAELYSSGRREEAVTALGDAVRFLTPEEAVAALEFLHAGRHVQLGQSLTQMIARERSAGTVIEVAVELKGRRMAELADSILAAAAAGASLRGGWR